MQEEARTSSAYAAEALIDQQLCQRLGTAALGEPADEGRIIACGDRQLLPLGVLEVEHVAGRSHQAHHGQASLVATRIGERHAPQLLLLVAHYGDPLLAV